MSTTVSTPRKVAATVSSSATLAKGRHTPVNAAAGALTMTLPTDAVAGVEVVVEKIDASANAVTITGTIRGTAAQSIALSAQYDARTFLSEGAGSWRPTSDHRTKTALDTSYGPAGQVASGVVQRRVAQPLAEIQLTPGKYHMTDRQRFTPTISQTGMAPLWMQRDQTTLIGRSFDKITLGWSTDDGATWTSHSQNWPGGILAIRELDNGEIIVLRNNIPGEKGSVWLSTGWAANHATATFAAVLHHQGAADGSWRAFSIDAYGPLVLVAEYGEKISVDNMGRYLHMSEDYGKTWRIIFDLGTPDHSTGVGAHLHAPVYDPWWDAIWLTNGDDLPNQGNWVSFDRGTTWKRVPIEHQFTAIYPMPNCILMTSDIANPNGIYRINRTHPDRLEGEWILTDNTTAITVYGGSMYRARHVPGAPLLIPCVTGTATNLGARLYATHDGATITEVWRDTGATYSNAGLWTMVGPTLSGKYFGQLSRDPNMTAANTYALSLTPGAPPEAVPGALKRINLRTDATFWYQNIEANSNTTIAPASGQLRVDGGFVVPVKVNSVTLGVWVTAAGDATSTVVVPVYADDGTGVPGVLLGSVTLDTSTTGFKSALLSVPLLPGTIHTGVMGKFTTTAPTVEGFGTAQAALAPNVPVSPATPVANQGRNIGYVLTGLTDPPATWPTTSLGLTTSVARVYMKFA